MTAWLAALVLLSTVVGCDSARNDGPPARIVPAESVEGIPLGASKEEAEAVLGEFEPGCGMVSGFRAWCVASFFSSNNDPLTGLRLYFIDEWSPDGYWKAGPLDFFTINPPYDGTTEEGIGIGSPKALVHAAFGSPDSIRIRSTSTDYYYCFGYGRRFTLTFMDGLVTSMHVGYFVPAPDHTRPCD